MIHFFFYCILPSDILKTHTFKRSHGMNSVLLALMGLFSSQQAPTIESLNPSQGYECIGMVPSSTNEYIDAQVAKARAASPGWSSLSVHERVAYLENVYALLAVHRDIIASFTSREMGMPIALAYRIDIDSGLAYMRAYLDYAAQWLAPEVIYETEEERFTMIFEARGVAGVVTAWNYPICNFIWAVMQNLIIGNTVVFKHSEECPLTGALLEQLMLGAGLPDGVFNAVHGTGKEVGDYLMHSAIDSIHFTGSSHVGHHLYKVAANKFIPATLELGGSAPGIICADADIDQAVESVYCNRFVNSGQTCDGLKRLLVHRSIIDQVIEQLTATLVCKKIGDAQDPATEIGPLVAERQVHALEQQVADAVAKGARVIIGGKRPAGLSGAYYEPTILTGITCDMAVWREEVFGPVLPIVPFDTIDEAIALANDTKYGLGGYVYSRNKYLAYRIANRLQTGNISINGADYVIAAIPFGGYKCSGLGREHGKFGLRELSQSKVIAEKK